jgi:chromosome segregation ATPase
LPTEITLTESADGFNRLVETVLNEAPEAFFYTQGQGSIAIGKSGTYGIKPTTPTTSDVPVKLQLGEPCSPELKACVDDLIAKGENESSAWAICKSKLEETKLSGHKEWKEGFAKTLTIRVTAETLQDQRRQVEQNIKITPTTVENMKVDFYTTPDAVTYYQGLIKSLLTEVDAWKTEMATVLAVANKNVEIMKDKDLHLTETANLNEIITAQKKTIGEMNEQGRKQAKDYNELLTEKNELAEKYKQLNETYLKIEKALVAYENAEWHLKGEFKGQQKSLVKPTNPDYSYTPGGK